MGVCGTNDIWAGSMDLSVYHECSDVEKSPRPRFLKDSALLVDEQKIFRLYQLEVETL
jgi:hypothetical protein